MTTTGVYIFVNLVINLSSLGFPAAAFSTLFTILVTIDSERAFSTLILSSPLRLTQPDITLSPGLTFSGTCSPVTDEVSILLWPSATTPSSGILSPAFTIITCPGTACSAGISITLSPSERLTV